MLFRQHLFIIRISRHLAHHLAVTRHEAGVELSASLTFALPLRVHFLSMTASIWLPIGSYWA